MRNVQAACDTDLPHTERAEHLQIDIAPAQRTDGLRRNEVALGDRLTAGRDRQRAERLPASTGAVTDSSTQTRVSTPAASALSIRIGVSSARTGVISMLVPSVTGTAGSSPGSGVTSA